MTSRGKRKLSATDWSKDKLTLFKAIVEASNEAIAISDRQGKIIYVNPAHEKLFGRSLDQAREANYRDYYPSESVAILNEKVSPALERGESWEGVLDAYDAKGSRFPLWERADTIRNKNGKMLYGFGIMHEVTKERDKEKALRQSQELFQKTFDNHQAAVFILGDGIPPRIKQVNKAFSRIFQYDPEDVLDRTTAFLHVDENTLAEFQQQLYPMIEQRGCYYQPEFYMKRKDESVFPAEIAVTPLENDSGDRIGWVSEVRDITKSKLAEKALKEEHRRFVTIMDSLDALVYVSDRQTYDLLFMNAALRRMHGNRVGEKCWAVIQSGQTGPCPFCTNDKLTNQAGDPIKPYVWEFNNSADGQWYQCRDQAIHWPDGRLVRLEIATNITSRKETEQALQQRVNFERLVSQIASEMTGLGPRQIDAGIERTLASIGAFSNADRAYLFMFREDGRHIDNTHEWCAEGIQPEIENLQGILFDEELPWVSTHIRNLDVVHAPDVAVLPPEARLEREHFGAQGIRSLIVIPMAAGERIIGFLGFDAVQTLRTWSREEQSLLHLVGEIFTHTIERRRAEEHIRQFGKTKSLERMAGAIAHQFNNHLAVIMGNLEMALDEPDEVNATSQKLKEAMQAAHKASEVSRLMLTYIGQTAGEAEKTDLSTLCNQSVSEIRAIMPENVVFLTDFPQPGPVIESNPDQVKQVLAHLIANAREAIGNKGGRIKLKITTINFHSIPHVNRFPIDWQPQKVSYACLEVTDTGHGIPETDIENLFDPFFSTQFTGRGLGLAAVIGILLSHDGCVVVESQVGQGSTFRIFLPACTQAATMQTDTCFARPEIQPKPLLTPRNGVVLVADDQSMVRKTIAAILRRIGFEVLTCADGVEAVDLFRQHKQRICLVISDLTMPRLNGWETLAAIRRIAPHTPVILTSGYDQNHVMKSEYSERPQAFLRKPFTRKELENTLAAIA